MNVELHIERLVLDGFNMEPWQLERLRLALEGEIRQHLLAAWSGDQRISPGWLRGAPLQVNSLQPEVLGSRIAGAVLGEIGTLSGGRHGG